MPIDAYKAIHRIADRLTPDMRRRFLSAVSRLRGRIDVESLALAVERGGISPALVKAVNGFPDDLNDAVTVINQAFQSAAAATATDIVSTFKLRDGFDIVNPRMVEAAAQHAAKLVTQVTTQTRQAINRIVTRAFTDGIPPGEAARLIKPLVGLTERQGLAVLHYRKALIDSGLTAAKVQQQAAKYANTLLRQRALNIARTETLGASNAGQVATWRQAQADGVLPPGAFKRWIVTPDDRLCDRCRPLHGQEVALDQPFTTDIGALDAPPLHPQCRCAMVLST